MFVIVIPVYNDIITTNDRHHDYLQVLTCINTIGDGVVYDEARW